MLVIGLTGPSGAGKGEVSHILKSHGAEIIDADAVYHSLLVPPSPCLDALCARFGKDVLNASGELDRQKLGSIVFSNQVYLTKNLEFESTLSLTSRIIDRLEETDGYRPGFTPVAMIGSPEASIFSVERKGFEHLSALDAAKANYAVTSEDEMLWYCWEVLGYPSNFVSTFELSQLKEHEAVKSMPAFPAEGCCAFVGDTLVLKLN